MRNNARGTRPNSTGSNPITARRHEDAPGWSGARDVRRGSIEVRRLYRFPRRLPLASGPSASPATVRLQEPSGYRSRAADDRLIRSEFVLPKVVRQHDDGISSRDLILVQAEILCTETTAKPIVARPFDPQRSGWCTESPCGWTGPQSVATAIISGQKSPDLHGALDLALSPHRAIVHQRLGSRR